MSNSIKTGRYAASGMMSAAAATVAGAAAIVLASTATAVGRAPGTLTVDDALGVLVLGIGALTAAWTALWALVSGVALLVAGVRRTPAPVERLIARPATPRLVRRGLTAALGLTLAVGASPALASPSAGDPADLGWDAAVVRAAELAAPGPASPPVVDQARQAPPPDAPPRSPQRASTPDPHVVVPGESLWSIAAEHLGAGASPGAVAAEWPRWYDANRAAVGSDPDLITPGLALSPPTDPQTSGG